MIAVLMMALVLDALVGEPDAVWSRLPHPAVLMGKAVSALERRLNHGTRTQGVVAMLIFSLGALTIGWLLQAIPGIWVEVVAVTVLIAQRSLTEHVAAVAKGLERSVEEGRQAVAMIVGRKTEALDQPAIARAAIESGAENLSDGVIAPAFWFLIGGLPGILLYKVVNTADSMIGYRTPRYARFGWAAARLDDLLNLIPARATAGLIAVVSGDLKRVWQVVRRDARHHRSPNAGWPESAMAAALNIALSGPRHYAEGISDDPYLNAEGKKEIGAAEIHQAVQVMWRAWAAALAVLLVIMVLA